MADGRGKLRNRKEAVEWKPPGCPGFLGNLGRWSVSLGLPAESCSKLKHTLVTTKINSEVGLLLLSTNERFI